MARNRTSLSPSWRSRLSKENSRWDVKGTARRRESCYRGLILDRRKSGPQHQDDESDIGVGRRFGVPRGGLWRARQRVRGGVFQHVDDGLPGDFDGPLLQGADRVHDVSADWQLRREHPGRGELETACVGVCNSRAVAGGEQLAGGQFPGGLSGEKWHTRHSGHRHTGADEETEGAGRVERIPFHAWHGRGGGKGPGQWLDGARGGGLREGSDAQESIFVGREG